jgi:nucleoside-diphosphate-sugar epimerase
VRILLAGATGVIGRALLPALLEQGHEVTAMCRSPEKLDGLRAQGAEAVAADALDADALSRAVNDARPQAVIHQLTSIPAAINPRTMVRDFALNDRLRTEGTANLLAAARAAGAERFIAQSIAFAYAPGPPGTVHSEQDPLITPEQAPKEFRRSAAAVAELERAVLGGDGVVLRYGYFYGPGSAISRDGSMAAAVRARRLPIVGAGAGVWSFIHVADAASATITALGLRGPKVLNVVDDEPARTSEWIPALSEAVGAPRPRRVPVLLARLAAGAYGAAVMTRAQGASNAAARAELSGWNLRHPSWREGFQSAL